MIGFENVNLISIIKIQISCLDNLKKSQEFEFDKSSKDFKP